jgi:hypothetical protein
MAKTVDVLLSLVGPLTITSTLDPHQRIRTLSRYTLVKMPVYSIKPTGTIERLLTTEIKNFTKIFVSTAIGESHIDF